MCWTTRHGESTLLGVRVRCLTDEIVLALLLIAPLLGLDNLVAAASISVARSDWRTCARVCVIFGGYALVAPLIGLLLGEVFAASAGETGRVLGGVALILIGLRGLVSRLGAPHAGAQRYRSPYDLQSILLIGASVSADNLVAGFGLGLYGVPIIAAVLITAGATVGMSLLGFRLGDAVAVRLGRYKDRLSSAALALIGAALLSHLI